jgi:AbrB family looped-hinge helix DNA binding protein
MTIIHMSPQGQVVVPKKIRDKHGFGPGSAFAVLATKSGAIVFRPVKATPKRDLVDHLLELKGLDMVERRHYYSPAHGHLLDTSADDLI